MKYAFKNIKKPLQNKVICCLQKTGAMAVSQNIGAEHEGITQGMYSFND